MLRYQKRSIFSNKNKTDYSFIKVVVVVLLLALI